ncbi:hypothetical protein NLJ89_g3557 [Agrocybe chaxingu]|uniref:Terpene synthase n=1 Tax=Agrocybe chaxingu TaxID=84603 RepID=A0A9W8K4H9_9AGAR|nr:hypothetical protein NLJ89_g3557 [Agrocybe chaxingu]
MRSSPTGPTSFVLPDLVSHCKFPLSYHPNGDKIAWESVAWLDSNCPDLSAKQRRALCGLQSGELTSYCYNQASSPERLRVVSDFLTYLFHLDNISDGMMTRETDVLADVVMNAFWFNDKCMPTRGPGKEQPDDELDPGKLAGDFWSQAISDCGVGARARFRETMGLFFEAVNIQARMRDEETIPDLEAYIDDIFSYNVEQSRGDTHNMIVILMQYHGHTLQSAVDYVGELCAQTIDTFCENKERLPSWGPEIDDMVARYVKGLQDWIVGSFHWSFQTQRYFGKDGLDIKKHRYVKLLPLEAAN